MDSDRPEHGHFLLVQLSSNVCAVELSQVVEVMRPLPLVPLAGMPAFVLGLSIIRGSPVPVVAVARMLNGTDDDVCGRFITLRIGTKTIALAVKGVLGVGSIDRTRLEALPTLLQNANSEAAVLIGTMDSQLLMALSTSRILSDDMWHVLLERKASPQ